MDDSQTLVYFFGNWAEDERATISDAALAMTPERVRRAWNAKLGHLWVVVRRENGSLSARMGNEQVEADTPESLAERVRAYDWSPGTVAWASGRGDGGFRG